MHGSNSLRLALCCAALLAAAGCSGGDVSVEGPGDASAGGKDAGKGGDTLSADVGKGDASNADAGTSDGASGDTGSTDAFTPKCLTDFDCVGMNGASSCSKPRCIGGACQLAAEPKGIACDLDGLEPSPCQTSVCDGVGKCTFADAPDGTVCDDGPCGDICVAGVCKAGGGIDDGDPCTKDYCEGGAVFHEPITDPSVTCDDGDPCTPSSGCQKGQCVGKQNCADAHACTIDFCVPGVGCDHITANGLCDDGNPCTEGVCTSSGCITKSTAGAPCDDGDACTKGEVCGPMGACEGGVGICTCTSDKDCGNDNLCINYACVDGTCQPTPGNDPCAGKDGGACGSYLCDPATGGCAFKPLKEGKPCDDGNACTSESMCTKGKCEPTKKITCDDGNSCTADACDAKAGCVSKPAEGKACDDGNACTAQDVCKGGGCFGIYKACNDGNVCTKDSCNPKDGACVNVTIPGCAGCASSVECDDKDPCTVDSCEKSPDGKATCTHTKSPQCGGTCDSDGACDDNDPCTKDFCAIDAAGQQICSHVKVQGCGDPGCKSDADCPQVDALCMSSVCEAGACKVKPIEGCVIGCKSSAQCDDKDPCTADVCTVSGNVGSCSHKPIPGCGGCKSDSECPQPGAICAIAVCKQGQCLIEKDPACLGCTSDAACDDNNACTVDVCNKTSSGGQCAHKVIPDCPAPGGCKTDKECDDDDLCTDEACVNGKCSVKPKACDDNNGCTTDACFAGKCTHAAKVCNDGKDCTYDACNPLTGACDAVPIPNCGGACKSTQDCTDNNPCVYSYCSGGTCKSQAKVCNDNNACTFDSCNPLSGACSYTPIPGCSNQCSKTSDCDDGNPCTYDTCSSFQGKCYNQNIPNCDPNKPKCKSAADCDDGKPCTTDSCSTFTGNCSHYNTPNCVIGKSCKDASECNDKNGCTTDLCTKGVCDPKPVSCDDFNPCTNDYCQTSTGKCVHTSKPGCVVEACKVDATCDDQNSCTKDICLFGYCQHLLDPGCN